MLLEENGGFLSFFGVYSLEGQKRGRRQDQEKNTLVQQENVFSPFYFFGGIQGGERVFFCCGVKNRVSRWNTTVFHGKTTRGGFPKIEPL